MYVNRNLSSSVNFRERYATLVVDGGSLTCPVTMLPVSMKPYQVEERPMVEWCNVPVQRSHVSTTEQNTKLQPKDGTRNPHRHKAEDQKLRSKNYYDVGTVTRTNGNYVIQNVFLIFRNT